jgi:hypothetical protein
MTKRRAMNSRANSRSVAATTVPDVKNSRTASKSRIWFARMPTEPGRCAILIDSTCSKISLARMTSSFLPVTSMMRALTVRRRKSKAIAMASPMLSAMSEGSAPFGTTRS